ncbi:MAG: tetratricopeptide (TPR) repeat protein [Planctomycetota bacterium]|jgi:tetratricopeptide (TPR) repeat protein
MEPLVAELIEGRAAGVRAKPENAKAWADLGFAMDAHMFLDEAEACLERALDLDSGLFPAAYDFAFLGTLLPREAEDVLARFRRVEMLRPDYAPAFARHGDFLLDKGDVEEASACYRSALGIAPEYAYAQLGLARSLVEREDQASWTRAAGLLEPLFRSFTTDPAVATGYGQALALLGQSEQAAEVPRQHAAALASGGRGTVPIQDSLRSEILALSRSASANYQRGEKKLRTSDYSGAANEFQRVLSVDPKNRAARFLLARARVAVGELGAARVELTQLLDLNASDPDAHALLGQVDTEIGEFESARKHFAAAARTGTLDGVTFRAWVTALGSLNRWDEALFRIDEWKVASPKAAEPYFLEALALHNAGRQDRAKAALNAAIARSPAHPMRRDLETLLIR